MNIITGLLCVLIVFIHKLNDALKLKLFMVFFNSIISQVIILNIILFSFVENTRVGTLLTILFFIILSFDKKKIKEEFISYYKK